MTLVAAPSKNAGRPRMEVVSEDGDAIDVVVALSNDLARFGISTMLERLAAVRSLTSCKTGAEAIDHLANPKFPLSTGPRRAPGACDQAGSALPLAGR